MHAHYSAGAPKPTDDRADTDGKVHVLRPPRPVKRRKAGGFLSVYTTTALGELAQLQPVAGYAYVRLLYNYWERRGPLPDDDKVLAQLAGVGARWRTVRPDLERFFDIRDGLWHHDEIDHQIEFFRHRSAEQARKVGIRWERERAGKAKP